MIAFFFFFFGREKQTAVKVASISGQLTANGLRSRHSAFYVKHTLNTNNNQHQQHHRPKTTKLFYNQKHGSTNLCNIKYDLRREVMCTVWKIVENYAEKFSISSNTKSKIRLNRWYWSWELKPVQVQFSLNFIAKLIGGFRVLWTAMSNEQ